MTAALVLPALLSPELGRFALALAVVIAAVQFVLPTVGAARRNPRLMATATPLAWGQFACLALSFVCLMVAAAFDDFSVQNVAENSAVAKPLLYKLTGVWGNHEGSVLLWALILGICGAAVVRAGRALPSALDRKSTRLNSSHSGESRMPSSA